MNSPPSQTPGPAESDEVSGLLRVASERKSGVYGAYWNVIMTPSSSPPFEATLSEKILLKSGVILPDPKTDVAATARKNSNGRWNITGIDAGTNELRAVTATFLGLLKTDHPKPKDAEGISPETPPREALWQFRLSGDNTPAREARLTQRAIHWAGFQKVPVNYGFVSDWSLQPWGWKLNAISEDSLRRLYQTTDTEMVETAGSCPAGWRFDEPTETDRLMAEFATDVPGLTISCFLYCDLLRNAGVRSVMAGEPVKAKLNVRDGRWRLAELIEPRPDLYLGQRRDIIYGVPTRFASQAENSFGEVIDWLEIADETLGIGITSIAHNKLEKINEGKLAPGAMIVCDLKKGNHGWYASVVHRVAD